ncbi:hypothetical protein ABHF33_03255 [Chitinibacter sp. FCG-7]|uniref:Uncharacterized protein n=1 Tax=Chitinibacter mangrovi TaxID=3153927 RepID=A0AAU7FCS7_9NEIS
MKNLLPFKPIKQNYFKVGELWRGADGNLNYTIGAINTPAKYFSARDKVAKHFHLMPIGFTCSPLDALTRPYFCWRNFAVIRLEWDIWCGFFVSAANPRSEWLLMKIATFCESEFK